MQTLVAGSIPAAAAYIHRHESKCYCVYSLLIGGQFKTTLREIYSIFVSFEKNAIQRFIISTGYLYSCS